jgi:hypothetical protein
MNAAATAPACIDERGKPECGTMSISRRLVRRGHEAAAMPPRSAMMQAHEIDIPTIEAAPSG